MTVMAPVKNTGLHSRYTLPRGSVSGPLAELAVSGTGSRMLGGSSDRSGSSSSATAYTRANEALTGPLPFPAPSKGSLELAYSARFCVLWVTGMVHSRRVAYLDVLRAAASISVLITPMLERTSPWFRSFRFSMFDLGFYGVTLFFLCIGYVIPRSIERSDSIGAGVVRFWAETTAATLSVLLAERRADRLLLRGRPRMAAPRSHDRPEPDRLSRVQRRAARLRPGAASTRPVLQAAAVIADPGKKDQMPVRIVVHFRSLPRA
jgi:hypothetical protein